jgi:hypothetical protein
MLNTEDFILLAGRPEKWDEEIRRQASRAADQNVRTNLPKLAEDQHRRGRRSVEVVKSAYGWTVRCASGLDNFQLVAGSCRHGAHWPGTYAAAAAWGINWANEDPENRECFVRRADAEETVTIEVEMQAFGDAKIRTVVIPAAEGVGQSTESPFWRDLTTDQKLDHIFYYGQNDSQPVANHRSVSVGDIIRLEGKRYRVDAVGFREMPESAPVIQSSPSGRALARPRNSVGCVGNWNWPIEEEPKKTVAGQNPFHERR